MPAKWLSCRQSADCTIIEFDCDGLIAVNRTYEDDTWKVIDFNGGSGAWAACVMRPPGPDDAICDAGKCAIKDAERH